jgi:lysophospholipid acyltransferase (LPLAT)-like uncharacterized protein
MSTTWRHRRRRLRNFLIGLLGPWLLRAWVGSLRIRWTGPGIIRPSPAGRQNVIYVFWHQRLLLFPVTHRGLGVRALISSHGDGEMLARVAEGLGHKAVRGSTTRGGTRAMKELLGEVGSGHDFVITPDGPQGPRHVFQIGAAFFASRSGLVVIPASASYRRSWTLPTWDGFFIPVPFTRAVIQGGEPLAVPADLDGEELSRWRARLEEALRAVTEDTDRRFEELYRGGLTGRAFRRLSPPFPWAAEISAGERAAGR